MIQKTGLHITIYENQVKVAQLELSDDPNSRIVKNDYKLNK